MTYKNETSKPQELGTGFADKGLSPSDPRDSRGSAVNFFFKLPRFSRTVYFYLLSALYFASSIAMPTATGEHPV